MKSNIIIYAIGIYKGGGLQVLKKFINSNKDLYYYFDSRLHSDHFKKIKNYKIVKQNFINLYLSYLELRKKKKNIFFINGLPPLIKFENSVFVLYQNLNIFPPKSLLNFIFWLFSYDSLRYIIFKLGYKNVQRWFVLSEVANQALHKHIDNSRNIKKVFLFDIIKKRKKNNYIKKYDFIYPADLKRHKNHNKLIMALLKLSEEDIKPSFLFTLTTNEEKKLNFSSLKKKINIHNFVDNNNRIKFLKKLKQSKCLFFPSEHETIGLPIIEAYNYNLLIATSNRKYAKQFIEPDIVFDCNSIISIKNTIKRIYLKKIKQKKNIKTKYFDSYQKKKEFFNNINE